LAGVAKRITSGDYDTPVQVQSNDELGDLAQGFTKMQSAIAERERHITYQAQHDSLTQLINRGRLFPELDHTIANAQAQQSRFALLAMDIDNFTRINDTLSPEIGDQVLQAVAQRIATHAGEAGVAVRLGSDEFALILLGVDAQRGQQEAEALLARFQPDIRLTAISLNVDINIGLVVYPDDGDRPETLLRRANLALNQSRNSQTRITVYQSGWDERHLRRLALFGELRNALLSGQISLNYQPKVYLANRRQLGAEALVRWQHPELGFVNPEEFIAVAESTGQIGLLTRWVVKTAINQLSQFKAQGYDLSMSVNLSALDLLDNTLPDYIQALVSEYRLDPQSLCLEITESAIMGEAEKSLDNLERLRQLGLVLSIDDFGTGYSSLSQLKKLPVSELKIDKSFIFNLVSNADDQLIVRSTIDLGHTLGLSITAEGVETQNIERLLEDMGCDTVQGYLYSKALPAAAFQQWLDDYYAQL
jgi:diguanylate cyclase (GGDEF)-like protein